MLGAYDSTMRVRTEMLMTKYSSLSPKCDQIRTECGFRCPKIADKCKTVTCE